MFTKVVVILVIALCMGLISSANCSNETSESELNKFLCSNSIVYLFFFS